MKNLRKLVIASFMLVIAFVAVVSSTYAWFTRGQEATVNNIEIGVVSAEKSLLIGKENNAWSKTVTVKPYGKLTPVTLESSETASNSGIYTVSGFNQLVWDGDLVPSFVAAQPLNEEYVKTSDAALDENKTYYTLTVDDDNNVTFTAVETPTAAGLAHYYEKTAEAAEYVKANANNGTYSASATYYTKSGDEYTKVTTNNEDDFANYYIANPALVASGYVAFNLYFQITVDNEDDWDTTFIKMTLDDLHAYNVAANGTPNLQDPNDKAISSFRMAIAEDNGTVVRIARIIEGASTSTGKYGEGTQFALTNGWLKMLHDSAINANEAIIEQGNSAYELADDYADAASTDTDLVLVNGQGTDGFDYIMECGNDGNATISTSGDGLTKNFHIVVYVWMEGWDGDNVNAAASCQYVFGLSFRAY